MALKMSLPYGALLCASRSAWLNFSVASRRIAPWTLCEFPLAVDHGGTSWPTLATGGGVVQEKSFSFCSFKLLAGNRVAGCVRERGFRRAFSSAEATAARRNFGMKWNETAGRRVRK